MAQHTLLADCTSALDKHIHWTGRAEQAARHLLQWIEDHGEVVPDDVNYAHVGDMAHVAGELEELVRFIRS